MNKILNKYIFPASTVINTIFAAKAIVALFSASATPLTAFLAVVLTFFALSGWIVIAYEQSVLKRG